jgi:hypothetical protein
MDEHRTICARLRSRLEMSLDGSSVGLETQGALCFLQDGMKQMS